MFHPLIQLLAARPQLLAGHASAYAELAAAQAGVALRSLRLRALLACAAVAALVVGLGLGGVALLLAAVIPVHDMPLPWLLLAAPATPLLLAAGLWLRLASTPRQGASLDVLRAQWAQDVALLVEAGAEAQSP